MELAAETKVLSRRRFLLYLNNDTSLRNVPNSRVQSIMEKRFYPEIWRKNRKVVRRSFQPLSWHYIQQKYRLCFYDLPFNISLQKIPDVYEKRICFYTKDLRHCSNILKSGSGIKMRFFFAKALKATKIAISVDILFREQQASLGLRYCMLNVP